jgi:hypothetical protein
LKLRINTIKRRSCRMAESMSTFDVTVLGTGTEVAGTVAGGGEGAAADGGAEAAGGALCAATTPTTNVPNSVRLSLENVLSADISRLF